MSDVSNVSTVGLEFNLENFRSSQSLYEVFDELTDVDLTFLFT